MASAQAPAQPRSRSFYPLSQTRATECAADAGNPAASISISKQMQLVMWVFFFKECKKLPLLHIFNYFFLTHEKVAHSNQARTLPSGVCDRIVCTQLSGLRGPGPRLLDGWAGRTRASALGCSMTSGLAIRKNSKFKVIDVPKCIFWGGKLWPQNSNGFSASAEN